MESNWILEQVDFISKEEVESNESLFTLGNGYLGLRGDLLVQNKAVQSGTYINGFYEKGAITYGEKAYGFAENWQTMIPVPEGKDIKIKVNGETLFTGAGKFILNRRILNMKKSCIIWNSIWEDKFGNQFKVQLTTVVPFSFKGTAIHSWTLELPKEGMNVEIESSIYQAKDKSEDTDDPRVGGNFNNQSLDVKSENKTVSVHASGSNLVAIAGIENQILGLNNIDLNCNVTENGYVENFIGTASKLVKIIKATSYSYGSIEDIKDIKSSVYNELELVKQQGIIRILEDQSVFMKNFWSASDVEIKGNNEAQISMRFNLFQLLQSVGRDGKRSIAAKGLSGPGYEGHYFWDAETYVLPFFIHTNPQIAKSMIEYRISILDKAKERAKTLGFDGILFPWRTINGEESSAYYPAGTAQYHINADIALALNKYLEITGDTSILKAGGDKILSGTADFWCSLGSDIPGKGICFNNVTGPDEYTAVVDNNYYTNTMAKANLEASAYWLKDLVSKDKIDLWLSKSKAIYIKTDVEITPQDDSFLEKEKWDFKNTKSSEYPLLLHFHPLNIYRKQVLKQADVVMTQALHRENFPPGLLKRNFDYYEELTTRDSSLSACAQGINAMWIGYEDLAWEYFLETIHTDKKNLHKNVFHGLHTASMGGAFLMMLNGFFGAEKYKESLMFRPKLPKDLSGIKLNITIKNVKLSLELNNNEITYKALNGKVIFYHFSRKVTLESGESLTFSVFPDFKLALDESFETQGFALEEEIFNSIKSKDLLPEEVLLIADNEELLSIYQSLGYNSIERQYYNQSNKDSLIAYHLSLMNIKKEFLGTRPKH